MRKFLSFLYKTKFGKIFFFFRSSSNFRSNLFMKISLKDFAELNLRSGLYSFLQNSFSKILLKNNMYQKMSQKKGEFCRNLTLRYMTQTCQKSQKYCPQMESRKSDGNSPSHSPLQQINFYVKILTNFFFGKNYSGIRKHRKGLK